MKYKNIPEMFFSQVKKYGDRAVQRYKKDGSWVDISWNQMKESAELIGLGLIDLGLKQKDSVCMLSENRPEWAHVDLGIISAGGVNVPIYATNTPQQVQYIVNDAEAQYLFVSNRLQLDKVLKIRGNVPKLKKVIILDHIDANPAPDFVTTLDGLKKKAGASKDKSVLDRRYQATQPDDLITIIYTSGTTGDPKGAMLTHRNILSNCEDIASYVPIDDTFVVLSFLPLSHVFERTAGYYTMLFYGATIAYAESIDRIVDNMAEIRPYAMVSVPRVYEKMYARIVEGVETGPSTKKKIFYWALDTGKQTIPYKLAGKPLPAVLSIKYAIAKKLVFSKIRAILGGRLLFFVSGGAPLSKELGEFFYAADVTIIEGYGLTETSPVLTVNPYGKMKFGTAGKPIPNCEIKIAPDGEILARGPMIMKGYFKKPEATAEAIEKDGYFHTGDIGFLDNEGYLHITDRKKDLIVTAGGKNIAPQPIENALKMNRYIEQVAMVGDKKPYCVALVVPKFDAVESYAKQNNIIYKDRKELVENPAIMALIQSAIDGVNATLAKYETIKKIKVLANEFTQETGELTPTLKVKRRVIMEKYKDAIEALYV
ncbi:MAG: long-chain fatty acid--CoA ligase [Deltaproteobacteria bacterium]|nr:long-chain fatty acid--CoA ligase [Deltaproteobacteria bacterium]